MISKIVLLVSFSFPVNTDSLFVCLLLILVFVSSRFLFILLLLLCLFSSCVSCFKNSFLVFFFHFLPMFTLAFSFRFVIIACLAVRRIAPSFNHRRSSFSSLRFSSVKHSAPRRTSRHLVSRSLSFPKSPVCTVNLVISNTDRLIIFLFLLTSGDVCDLVA